ncbi:hypothetical protein EDC01DRAFT_256485 [Geopyxis carbonaria]|nr:hypothetical protein EDC01DRAFT_256485 [Geopyxis carbonaria]
MAATMTLSIISPNAPESESDANDWFTEASISDCDADDQDNYTLSSRNGAFNTNTPEPFRYDRSSAGLTDTPTTAEHHLPPLSASVGNYDDPFIEVKDSLWLFPNIDNVVRHTLARMEKMFAYNAVYFLKVVLDLQSVYLPIKPPKTALLDVNLVLEIAKVLSTRLIRRGSSTPLSQELQLRTLISALTLLHQMGMEKLNSDIFAELLRHVSERDADNEAKVKEGKGSLDSVDDEFLTRYACDIIRGLPTDLPPMTKDLNQEAIHFLFATGFINQIEDSPSRKTIDALFLRITASPSEWHADMRSLHEGTLGAISLQHQALFRDPPKGAQYASVLAADVARSVINRLDSELKPFLRNRQSLISGLVRGTIRLGTNRVPSRDTQLFVCSMLDCLVQLVAAFPTKRNIVQDSKSLAHRLIGRSEIMAFRYKAFEIILASTVGASENEYYDTLRDLEFELEETARAGGYFDTRTDDEKQEALERVEQLKLEKEYITGRWEQKIIRYNGAADSIQRRIMGYNSGKSITISTTWERSAASGRPASPVPSSRAPTLSPSCESSGCLTHTITCTNSTNKPGDSPLCTCAMRSSYAESHKTLLSSRLSTCTSTTAVESPVLGNYPLSTPQDSPHDLQHTNLSIQELTMSQVIPNGMSMFFEEPEEIYPNGAGIRKESIDLPIQNFDRWEGRKKSIEGIAELESTELPFRKASTDTLGGNSIITQTIVEGVAELPASPTSPTSIFAEPSVTRQSSIQSNMHRPPGPLRRSSHVTGRPDRIKSPRLDKPLPPIVVAERPKNSILADDAPEVVVQPEVMKYPMRSQSAMELRNFKSERIRNNQSSLGFRTPGIYQAAQFSPLPPIVDAGVDHIPGMSPIAVNYKAEPNEIYYKVHSKDSCFSTAITLDARHSIFLSPHSFQVFEIGMPDEELQLKPKFHYRLGDSEGLKKNKVPWQYKAMAVSDRYVVTISKERLQVHDLGEDCRIIFSDQIKGWEHSCVAISNDKLVVGLSKALRGENIGMLRLYRMNAPTYEGHRYERVGKDIHLPIPPQDPQDAPHILWLNGDGSFLTCGTPSLGYYFAWDIARLGEPKLMMKGQLRCFQGPGAEMLTGVELFPDAHHLLCSTYPIGSKGGSGEKETRTGSYTETLDGLSRRAICGVSPRVNHSAIHPYGDACAFLTKNGTIWCSTMEYIDGDDNLTSYDPYRSKKKLRSQDAIDPSGKVAFSPHGERIVGVDKKGNTLILNFPIKVTNNTPLPPEWAAKSEVGGYF